MMACALEAEFERLDLAGLELLHGALEVLPVFRGVQEVGGFKQAVVLV